MHSFKKSKSPATLLKTFTIFSLLSFLIVLSLIWLGIHQIYKKHSINNAEHVALTIGKILFEKERELLFTSDSEGRMTLGVTPENIPELDREIHEYLNSLDILKIKFYSNDKKIVYSTDNTVIGQIDTQNEELTKALNGEVVSKMETKEKNRDIKGEQKLAGDLVEIYVPVRDNNNEIVGAFEVYVDITHTKKEIAGVLQSSMIMFGFSMLFILGFLFVLMRHGTSRLVEREEALQESEESYRSVVEAAFDAIISVDSNGKIIFWTPAARRIFGYSADDVLGKPVTLIMPERLHEAFQKALSHSAIDGKLEGIGGEIELVGLRKDRREFPIEISISSWETKEEIFFSAIIRDITERKEAKKNLIRRTEILNAINKVFEERIKCETEEELGKMCLVVAEELTGSRFGYLGELNSNGLFDTIAISNPGWDACKVPDGQARLVIKNMPVAGIDRSTIREGKSRIVNGEEAFAKHPDSVGTPDGHPKLTAFLGVPLKEESKIVGMIGLGNKEGGYSIEDQENIEALSVAVLETLKSKRAEEKIQTQFKRFNILRFMEMTISSSLDLHVTLDILLIQITTQLGIDAASILLLNKRTQLLEHVGSKGFRSGALKYTRLKLGESNAGRAATEQRIVVIPDLKGEPDGFVRSELFKDEDFVSYIAVPLIAKGEIKGVLELFHRSPLRLEPEWLEFLENIGDQAAIAIDNATLFDELTLAYDTTIEGWSRALDMRDKETEGHSQRVAETTLRIARELGMKGGELVNVRRGALLHDIGKMSVPDNILLKPGPLTEQEWEIMKRHTEYAYNLLYPIEYLRPAIDIPYYHHEKWDGTGYPQGLKGEEIPLAARIFALVDVWDALNSARPYRPAWSKEKVIEYIRSQAGIHFDTKIAEIFLSMEL